MSRRKILICIDWYDPAFKAGGPIRSCVNMVQYLSPVYDCYIITSNHDLDENIILPGIVADQWIKHPTGANVWYASKKTATRKLIAGMMLSLSPDVLYLNSMFSKPFTIDAIRAYYQTGKKAKLILCPRGMLKSSALAFKPLKKKIFLSLIRFTGIHRKIEFIATNEEEASDIRNVFPGAGIKIAPNFPGYVYRQKLSLAKERGSIKLLFVGRIHAIKNLKFLLELLLKLKGKVQLDIIGVLEDKAYWQECLSVIERLPSEITVNFKGELAHHLLADELASHHLFALPTRGENYGHAIAESLENARPVLISDQTPWRNLAINNAGWDFSLNKPGEFLFALQESVNWEQKDFDLFSNGALRYFLNQQNIDQLMNQYQKIFN